MNRRHWRIILVTYRRDPRIAEILPQYVKQLERMAKIRVTFDLLNLKVLRGTFTLHNQLRNDFATVYRQKRYDSRCNRIFRDK